MAATAKFKRENSRSQHGIVNLRIFNSCVKIRNYTAFSFRIDSAVRTETRKLRERVKTA